MLLMEPKLRYRYSRSAAARSRAMRRLLQSDRETRQRFQADAPRTERRREERRRLRVPVYLRRAGVRGLSVTCDPSEAPRLGVTQDVSLSGLGWLHDTPLPAGRCLVEFDVHEAEPLVLLVEVCWTVQDEAHAYRSGGRILGVCRRAPDGDDPA